MFIGLIKNCFGTVNSRYIQSIGKIVDKINHYEPLVNIMSDDDFLQQTLDWRHKVANGMSLDDILIPAFASVREVARRKLNMRHFDVQLMGGITLHNGMIAEMKTGEGKTLVATLAAYLNSLTGKGVHIATVNDYLVKRDCEWMSVIYQSLGMSVGYITQGSNDEERRYAYHCDITYLTSNELGFDYLRDNMKYSRAAMTQRGLNFCIVDEVDFELIDEARTPLIISGPIGEQSDVYLVCSNVIEQLNESHYILDHSQHSIVLNDNGMEYVSNLLHSLKIIDFGEYIYDVKYVNLMHIINQSLKAKYLYTKDCDYIVKDGQIIIIDEFTGRMMEGRRYSDGLHQAIEAKEKVVVKRDNMTLASITFQNLFRMYEKLAGMTGTAMTEADEFSEIYNLDVREIPAHLPVKRIDEDDDIFLTEEEKYDAVINAVKDSHAKGQPVLIGTSSIVKSEHLSMLLNKNGLSNHCVLNAKYHEMEAKIISQAGSLGAITIATNMAGRGTDIKLGGNVDYLLLDDNNERLEMEKNVEDNRVRVLNSGGLLVIGTERHDSRRVDNQLRGRSGRQGDLGRSKFFISLEDDLMRSVGMEKVGGILSKIGMKKGDVITHPLITKSIEKAQQKVEARNFAIRKSTVKYDDVVDRQRRVVFEQRNIIIDSDDMDIIFLALLSRVNSRIAFNILQMRADDEVSRNELKTQLYMVYNFNLDLFDFTLTKNNINDFIDDLNQSIISYFSEKYKDIPQQVLNSVKKHIWLVTLDYFWREHLSSLDFLRQSIGLRAIGQKDPYQEFSFESFKMFNEMLDNLDYTILERFSKVNIGYESN